MDDSVQPSRNPANSGDLTGGMREILSKFIAQSVDDTLPAVVTAYDRATNRATVQPMIAILKTDGSTISRHQFASIPVLNIGGGSSLLSFNLVPGDLGWIKATDRDIAEFLKTFKESPPSTKRVHDFSSGIFWPHVMKDYTIHAEDEANAVLQTADGAVRISLFNDKLKITAPSVEVDSPQITATGAATINGAVLLGGAGGAGIARIGDTVQVGASSGTITGGSAIHKAT